jgi:hypothetical protein
VFENNAGGRPPTSKLNERITRPEGDVPAWPEAANISRQKGGFIRRRAADQHESSNVLCQQSWVNDEGTSWCHVGLETGVR